MRVASILTGVAFTLLAAMALRALLRRSRFRPLTPGSVALITGGGSGIGLELARLFSRAGCHVVLVGRNETALREGTEFCLSHGARSAEHIVVDLNQPDAVSRMRSAMQGRDQLKYLVLNAGIGAIMPFSTNAQFQKTCETLMQVNYMANVQLMQAFLPMLERTHSEQEPSRVIVMSSLAGILPSTFRSGYTASKHAIQGFMNALRGETEVSITLCCPGYVDTAFHQNAQANSGVVFGSHRRGVPPSVCAQQCLDGALHGDMEVLTTLNGKLGYMLRPFLTSFIDRQAKAISVQSLE